MIKNTRLFEILRSPNISEKSSIIKKNSTIVFKVMKNATKLEIKYAINKLFNVEIYKINTLVVKGKIKRYKKLVGRRNDWKKAYIKLKKGQKINFITNTSSE